MRTRTTLLAVGSATALLAAASIAPATSAGTDSTALRTAVTVEGIMEHERALQAIADANDGNRASGTSGYDASAAYVQDVLEDAGYTVRTQEFDYEFFDINADPILDPTSPDRPAYVYGEDIDVMEYSGSGDVTKPVTPVDLTLPPTPEPSSTSGCESSDFDGFPEGNIALIQRGTCDFSVKADNAIAAGAGGVVIFNEGQNTEAEDRTTLIGGTLGVPQRSIPVLDATFEVGNELATLAGQPGGVTVRAFVDADVSERTTSNVIADSPSGRTDRT